MTNCYEKYAPVYRNLGMYPRPIQIGTKACRFKNWQMPDNDLPAGTIEKWQNAYGHFGIGLLMGSPLPDGTRLGALDVDRNEYAGLARTLLRNPVCSRIGEKGEVSFVRVRGDLGNPEFRVDGPIGKQWGKVAECLFVKRLCVIPPTIHPNTNRPYRWVGKALHEVDLLSLPLIGE